MRKRKKGSKIEKETQLPSRDLQTAADYDHTSTNEETLVNMRNEEFRHSLMADKNSSSPSEDQGTFLYIPQVYPKKRQEIYKPVI